jgi:alginate O-acetyltransferase complex protein AlgJ
MLHIKKWVGCTPVSISATLLLAVSIIVGVLWLIVAPKETFSENENRVLESMPTPTIDSILDGRFMQSAENYVSDHFPLRNTFVSLNTAAQLFLGRRDLGADYSMIPAQGGV